MGFAVAVITLSDGSTERVDHTTGIDITANGDLNIKLIGGNRSYAAGEWKKAETIWNLIG